MICVDGHKEPQVFRIRRDDEGHVHIDARKKVYDTNDGGQSRHYYPTKFKIIHHTTEKAELLAQAEPQAIPNYGIGDTDAILAGFKRLTNNSGMTQDQYDLWDTYMQQVCACSRAFLFYMLCHNIINNNVKYMFTCTHVQIDSRNGSECEECLRMLADVKSIKYRSRKGKSEEEKKQIKSDDAKRRGFKATLFKHLSDKNYDDNHKRMHNWWLHPLGQTLPPPHAMSQSHTPPVSAHLHQSDDSKREQDVIERARQANMLHGKRSSPANQDGVVSEMMCYALYIYLYAHSAAVYMCPWVRPYTYFRNIHNTNMHTYFMCIYFRR